MTEPMLHLYDRGGDDAQCGADVPDSRKVATIGFVTCPKCLTTHLDRLSLELKATFDQLKKVQS